MKRAKPSKFTGAATYLVKSIGGSAPDRSPSRGVASGILLVNSPIPRQLPCIAVNNWHGAGQPRPGLQGLALLTVLRVCDLERQPVFKVGNWTHGGLGESTRSVLMLCRHAGSAGTRPTLQPAFADIIRIVVGAKTGKPTKAHGRLCVLAIEKRLSGPWGNNQCSLPR
jgi:hypothetical protein